jgi:MFS family permease
MSISAALRRRVGEGPDRPARTRHHEEPAMTAATRPDAPPENRWIALLVLCAGMLMIVLDATIVNVALPSIQDDLAFSGSGLAWVVNAYLIAFGGLLLLAGTLFPEPREQAKAIGVYAFVASSGGSIGLLVGGALTQALDWHWIFFVNVPIGLATALAARRLIARDAGAGLRSGADLPGAVLVTGALMLAVYTIVKPAAEDGWGARTTLACAAATLLLLVAFVAREASARSPLVPLGILRSRTIAGANAIQALSAAGMFGTFFLGSLFLERVLGYDALEIGLAFLPVTLLMGVVSLRYADRLAMRLGARGSVIAGLALLLAGLALFAQVPADAGFATSLLAPMALLGVGAGVCFPALMNLAMSGATPQDAGLASGLVNTTAQVGGALALAVLATVSSSHADALARAGASSTAALTGGFHLALWIAAALVATALLLAVFVVPRPSRAPAADAQVASAAA